MSLRRSMLVDLLFVAERAMTGQDHLAQVVPWEHLGSCSTAKGCTKECQRAVAARDDLRAYLEMTEHRRADMPAPIRMTRRPRSTPGRSLPSAPARARAGRRAV